MTHSNGRPIFVTGCARSGTSLIAGILHHCGVWGGEVCGPTPANPRGQFENRPITERLIKDFLRRHNLDPMGQDPLPHPVAAAGSSMEYPELRRSFLRMLESQGYGGGRFYYKGAKMILLWRQFHTAFPEAQWIITQRDRESIVDSCLNTSFMRAFKGRVGWRNWVDYHLHRIRDMEANGVELYRVWTPDVAHGNYQQIRAALTACGVEWNADAVDRFVTRSLWHYRSREDGKS